MALELDDNHTVWHTTDTKAPLLVILHGRDSSPQLLLGRLGQVNDWPNRVAVRAPISAGPDHARWFEPRAQALADSGDASVITDAASALLTWLDTHVASDRPVALLGFSQGGAIATQALRLSPDRFFAIVNLAGYVPPGTLPQDASLAQQRPAVFYGIGDEDTMVPPELRECSHAWLAEHAAAEVHEYSGLSHDLAPKELADVVRFLQAHAPSHT